MARILFCCSNGQFVHAVADGLRGDAEPGYPIFFALTVPESPEEVRAAVALVRGGFSDDQAIRVYVDLDSLPEEVLAALAKDDEASCSLKDLRWSLAVIPATNLSERTAHRAAEGEAWRKHAYLESCSKDGPAPKDALAKVGLQEEADEIEKVPRILQSAITAVGLLRLKNALTEEKARARAMQPAKRAESWQRA